ncbi:MAG: M4 family metallopeptidase, partial [Candidatus Kerfeldbacteria bacterium]|nr:M4 family metallopeptidase [Candidatus Kerfeldbacteria bacterium]
MVKRSFLWSAYITAGISSLFLITPTLATTTDTANLSSAQQISYQQLSNQAANLNVSWDAIYNTPRFISASNFGLAADQANFEDRTVQFINTYKALLKFRDDDQSNVFKPIVTKTDKFGMHHTSVEQYFKDVPVYGVSFVAHYRTTGALSSINSNVLADIPDIDVQPSISATQAIAIAQQYLAQSDKQNGADIKQKLYIYNHGIYSHQLEATHLVWNLRFAGRSFFIDAHSGEIVHVGTTELSVKTRETYVLADCLDYFGTLTYNEAGLVDTYDAQAELAHNYAGNIYEYYYNSFSRDSFDAKGSIIKSYTHYEEWDDIHFNCKQIGNAFWDGYRMKYGENFIVLDVSGHEMTHGVIQYAVGTTDDDTLEYENESGALNESYADIFGELVEQTVNGITDWKIGEDLVGGPIRDLANPNQDGFDRGQPYNADNNNGEAAHVEQKVYYTHPLCDGLENDDYGCVHLNSTIPSNALYLLVNGGTNPYSGLSVAAPIGKEAAEQIYYQVLNNNYLATNATFDDDFNGTMQACFDLYQSDPATYPLSYCDSIFDTFTAVGINTASSFPIASISASTNHGTAPLAVTFDGSSSLSINSIISSYSWDFDDGSTDSGASVSHTFNNPGSYYVALTVTDALGKSATDYFTITVYATGTINTTTWVQSHSPYVISGSVSVANGNTLTIEPGTTVKFLNTTSTLTVSGTLDARGTSDQPIIFTSYKDDTYGGDTNND